jgi:acetate---CoA ligase (ADP-forming)
MTNLAARELVTPLRLRAFFAPESLAVVGASENSGWARFIVASCATTGFAGPLTAVHPRATSAFGLPVVPNLRDLPEPTDLAFILFCGVALPEVRPPAEALAVALETRVDWLAQRMAAAPIPVIPAATTCVDVSGYGRGLLTRHGINILGGLDVGMIALGHALRWLENRGRVRPGLTPVAAPADARGQARPAAGLWSEAAARHLLAATGVPVVPGELAGSAAEAVAIARKVGLPVALKICSAQITHKSDVGGVVLGLGSEAEVRAGYEKVRAAGEAVPGASIDGVLVTPMRTGGTELLAGVTMDPTFGPVLAVGLGGIWVEILKDASLRLLPVDAAEVKRMLGELRGWPLLQGARGAAPANLDAVAEAIAGLGRTALSLNGALRALEVNPLWVDGDQVEALDVLVVTGPEGA